MLEYHGFKVKKITLLWINPKSRLIEIFDMPNVENDITKLLNHFKAVQEF